MKKLFIYVAIFGIAIVNVRADQGMWLPFLIEKYNIGKMTEMGLKLSAEDIYSINDTCLKDAIVALDYGSCTGELISKNGLLLTNHHCGYGEIQYHSSVEHDYLTNGFWAIRYEDELVNEDKTASFLIRVEDVTDRINAALTPEMDEKTRLEVISKLRNEITEETTKGTHYNAEIGSMFKNNFFYLFVYETFKDVRLVGCPPESIGKFGADTDNWMWPRHTADFCIFRIYAGPDGKPALPDAKNVPYKPKHHLSISLNGYNEGDFAMILGYPGNTTRYLTSWGVKENLEVTNPNRIKIRGIKQDVWEQQMDASDEVRIKYSSKYASSANYWKYSIGQNKGLKRLKTLEERQSIEKQFSEWLISNEDLKKQYGDALKLIEEAYNYRKPYINARQYLNETLLYGAEIFSYSNRFSKLGQILSDKNEDQEKLNKLIKRFKANAREFFKDYDAITDQKVTVALLSLYRNNVPAEFQPVFLDQIDKKYKGNFEKYVSDLFSKSIFADSVKLMAFLEKPNLKALSKDPAYIAALAISEKRNELYAATEKFDFDLARGERLFQAGLLQMKNNEAFAPDANSTMRLTYGTVCSYKPMDAVEYSYFTTMKGVMEKEDPSVREFNVPAKLKELYSNYEFSPYSTDSIMRTCFLTNNDITGGNSGSPVMNAKGQLIGIAFDGNWEAMAGDIVFEPPLQRCINADIRYVLFLIDKFAGAKNLIEEMTIVRD